MRKIRFISAPYCFLVNLPLADQLLRVGIDKSIVASTFSFTQGKGERAKMRRRALPYCRAGLRSKQKKKKAGDELDRP